jgi:hypothetical protein
MRSLHFDFTTHAECRIYENNIQDLERLVELGMVGIEDLAKQAARHLARSSHGRTTFEYYAGYMIHGEDPSQILEARRQVLTIDGRHPLEFPTLNEVISQIYSTNLMASPALRNLFTEEFNRVETNISTLYRELTDELFRLMQSRCEPFFHNTDRLV